MEKKIKDYFHLYLGCEVLVYKSIIGILASVPNKAAKENFAILINGRIKYYADYDFELILRPLSDINEDEYVEIQKLRIAGYLPEVMRYQLNKGFDLFNLIPLGLAIDKTNMPV